MGWIESFYQVVNIWTELKELTVHPNASTILESVFIVFQMAFAIISGAIITGSFVERMKFSALLMVYWCLDTISLHSNSSLGMGI